MKANIKKQKSLFNIKDVGPQLGIIQVLNIETGKYVDTTIRIVYSDTSLSERSQSELILLAEQHDKLVAEVNLEAVKDEADKEARLLLNSEDNNLTEEDIDAVKTYAIAATSMLTQSKLGKIAEESFDKLFSSGALSSLVTGIYGYSFTPDFLTIIAYIQTIITIATSVSASHIGNSYAKLTKSLDKIKEHYEDV